MHESYSIEIVEGQEELEELCSCNNIEALVIIGPISDYSKLMEMPNLTMLSFMHISVVNFPLEWPPHLRSLTILDCSINEFPNRALPETLTSINITRTLIKSMPSNVCNKNLTTLKLYNNKLEIPPIHINYRILQKFKFECNNFDNIELNTLSISEDDEVLVDIKSIIKILNKCVIDANISMSYARICMRIRADIPELPAEMYEYIFEFVRPTQIFTYVNILGLYKVINHH